VTASGADGAGVTDTVKVTVSPSVIRSASPVMLTTGSLSATATVAAPCVEETM